MAGLSKVRRPLRGGWLGGCRCCYVKITHGCLFNGVAIELTPHGTKFAPPACPHAADRRFALPSRRSMPGNSGTWVAPGHSNDYDQSGCRYRLGAAISQGGLMEGGHGLLVACAW
jgi:hypothetical protein